jgi:plastocyanin
VRRLGLVIAAVVGMALASAAPAGAANASIGTLNPSSWDPANVTINPGEQVTWTNTSGGFHSLRLEGVEKASASATMWTYSQPFDEPGIYHFVCGVHANMTGTVTVNPIVYTWTGTTGADWTSPANWSSSPSTPSTYPGGHSPTDVVVIDNGTRPQLDVDVPIADLQVSGAGSGREGSGTLTVAKTATATGDFAGTGKTIFQAANLTVTGLLVEGSATARFTGNTHLTGTVTLADTAKLETAGTLHGEGGSVAGDAGTVVNSGTVDPGGTLTFHSAYQQTSAGTLAIDVGSGGAERLVTNGATLDGTLAVHTTGGFQPTASDTFNVLAATSLTGQFATVSADKPGGITYKPNYANTGVTLSVEAAPTQTQDPPPTNQSPPPSDTTPTETVTEILPVTTTKVAITKLAVLPRRCGRGHSLNFRLKKPAGALSAQVLVNGKRKASRSGRTFTTPITLRKLPKRFTLTVQVMLASGNRVVATKKFTRC